MTCSHQNKIPFLYYEFLQRKFISFSISFALKFTKNAFFVLQLTRLTWWEMSKIVRMNCKSRMIHYFANSSRFGHFLRWRNVRVKKINTLMMLVWQTAKSLVKIVFYNTRLFYWFTPILPHKHSSCQIVIDQTLKNALLLKINWVLFIHTSLLFGLIRGLFWPFILWYSPQALQR